MNESIWVFGDSLTAGNCGESWVSIIKEEFSVKVFGLDGDTLSGIAVRCLRHLKQNTPEVLVLEAGANDVMQPYMKNKSPDWAGFIEDMNSRGAIAFTDPKDFILAYQELLNNIRKVFSGAVLVMSLPLLSENSHDILNKTAEKYNSLLEMFCRDNNIVFADIYAPLKACLAGNETGNGLFHYYNKDSGLFVRDIKAVRAGTSWDEISRKRGLQITVDGSHLNKAGAEIVAEVFRESIKKYQGATNE